MPMSFRTSQRKNVPIDRRQLIGGLGAGCACLLTAPAVVGRALAQNRRWSAHPFSLGVASGAPRPDGFVLWTRLAGGDTKAERMGGPTPILRQRPTDHGWGGKKAGAAGAEASNELTTVDWDIFALRRSKRHGHLPFREGSGDHHDAKFVSRV